MEMESAMFTDSEEEEFLPSGLQSDISDLSSSCSSQPQSAQSEESDKGISFKALLSDEAILSDEASDTNSQDKDSPMTLGSIDFTTDPDSTSNQTHTCSSESVPCEPKLSSAFVSVPQELLSNDDNDDNSSSKTKTNKKVKRKRKVNESRAKDGEKKKRKKKKNADGESEPKKKKKNKPANKRRNIKKLLTEGQLTANTLAAQLEEEQRKKRLLEFQKSREVTSPEPAVPSSSLAFHLNALLDKPVAAFSESVMREREEAKAKLVLPLLPKAPLSKKIEPECIVLDNSSGSEEDPASKNRSVVKKQTDVIEILSSDDEIVMETDSDDAADDMENSGQHTNDERNQRDALGRILVNINHPPTESDIYLAPQLAKAVKPHQVGGIRFLYDNLVESVYRYDRSSGFGCILAHSMGLGKTIQVISFIDVLLRHTTAKCVLCIVPINTIQNWVSEFDMWLPAKVQDDSDDVQKRDFNLYLVSDNHKTTTTRAKVLADWYSNGGVLLVGYEMYRLLTIKKFTGARKKKKSKNPDKKTETVIDLEEEDRKAEMVAAIQKALVYPGPDLVICDEGHRIKNSHASISQTLKNIQTRRRVVLTGYPLQNNLLEYWCMVDFVRPNFLGTKAEFCNLFERPIMNGQCVDSTYKDIKMMQYRAHVLHSLLEGFVQRRSHSVLQRTLPSKEEHVILVRLTPMQRVLYHRFMYYFKESGSSGWCSSNPIRAFSVCCKIWNHPDVLYQTIQQRSEAESADIDTDLDLPDVASRSASPNINRNSSSASLKSSASSASLAEEVVKKTKVDQLAEKIQQMISLDWATDVMRHYKANVLSNSNKMVILFQILDGAMAKGDKCLVFSQSLCTLTLIEKFLAHHHVVQPPNAPEDMPQQWIRNKSYFRLDGSSPPMEREKMIKHFNSPSNTSVWLFLLSTRAGCLGVNLVGANRVIVFDASWNPCHDAQAVCRVYRYGQQKKCFVYRLVSDNTLERKIFDRQISKQGMSDRVIDELNPEVNLTKKEVESLLEYDESDLPYEDFSHHSKKYNDPILINVCDNHSQLISKEPFTHESLLIDRSELKLTRAEKKAAKKSYEAEKKLNISYSRPSYAAFYPKASSAGTSSSPSLQNFHLSRFPSGHGMTMNRPVASVRPMQTTPIPMQPASRVGVSDQVKQRLLNLKQAGVTVQKIVTTTAICLPGTTTSTTSTSSPIIGAGETINIIRTQKGIYIRNQDGKIFAVRPGLSKTIAGVDLSDSGIDSNEQTQQREESSLSASSLPPSLSIPSNINSNQNTSDRPRSTANRTSTATKPDKQASDNANNQSTDRFSFNNPSELTLGQFNSDISRAATSTTDSGKGLAISTPRITSSPTADPVNSQTSSSCSHGDTNTTATQHTSVASCDDKKDTRTPPMSALSMPTTLPFPMMNLPGLPYPMAQSHPLAYFPVPGMPTMGHGSSMTPPPMNTILPTPSMLLNPMAHLGAGGYPPSMGFPPTEFPMPYGQFTSSGSSQSSHRTSPVPNTVTTSTTATTSEGHRRTASASASRPSDSPLSLSNALDVSPSSSRISTPSDGFGEVGDLANLINFTQSNWLQNSMQKIGEIDKANENATQSKTSESRSGNTTPTIDLPSDWSL
ncbi:helicase ARIP4-like [Glandiceps talaboti]